MQIMQHHANTRGLLGLHGPSLIFQGSLSNKISIILLK